MPPTLPSLASTYPSMNVDIVNVIESSIPRRLRLNCSIPDTVRPLKSLPRLRPRQRQQSSNPRYQYFYVSTSKLVSPTLSSLYCSYRFTSRGRWSLSLAVSVRSVFTSQLPRPGCGILLTSSPHHGPVHVLRSYYLHFYDQARMYNDIIYLVPPSLSQQRALALASQYFQSHLGRKP
jgi:hypothetical protein